MHAERRRVLLIDDDEDEFVLTRSLFAEMRSPFELEWAGTYQAGLEVALNDGYDVYLVDYRLGARSGVELIREAQAGGCQRPMILLTGLAEAEVDLEALRAGAADYVSKRNLTPPLLERSLLYALERHQASAARRDLEVAERTRVYQQQILAIVGHDLRGPLTAAQATLTGVLRSPELPEALRGRLERVVRAQARMERITRDLTDFTRAGIGQRLSIAPQPADIHRICQEVLGDVAASHPGRRIDYQGLGEPTGLWDPNRLAQAIENLLLNALKYGRADRPVRLSWGREGPGPAGELRVEVHNEGEPIPAELVPHLFEPFQRGRHGGGGGQSLGLGLFIVRQIVAAHGGEVTVASSAEEGTTFALQLPAAPRAEERAAESGAPAAP